MGDCGSFTYIQEDEPPYSVNDVIDFYDGCGFDYGISVDHVVFGWDPQDQAAELAEWTMVASELLNTDEFLTK